jgi:hypothetical protein
MDRAWLDGLLEKLGPRYKAGDLIGEGIELRYRFGKAEFQPARVIVLPGPKLELGIDFRVPKGVAVEDTEPLLKILEEKSLLPRQFTRFDDQTLPMKTEGGKESGFVRSLKYGSPASDQAEAARRIRSIVESIDIPIVLGIHEAKDLLARDPPPPGIRKADTDEAMELWEYTLVGGLLSSVNVVIDPNVRTLKVVSRKMISKDSKEPLKLAHVQSFVLKKAGADAELVAIKRDGTSESLAIFPPKEEALATAERMAKKLLIPIARA